MGSIHQRSKTTFRLTVDGAPDPVTGARRQHTRTFHGTKTQAKDELARFTIEVRGIESVGTALTFAHLVDHWLPLSRGWLEEQTHTQYVSTCRLHLVPALGDIPLKDLRPHHLTDLYAALVATGGTRGQGLQPATVHRIHSTVMACLTYAERNEWIPRNPARLAQLPKKYRRRPQAPPTSELVTLLDHLIAHQPDLYIYVELVAHLGARPGEVCGLQWGDVDWAAGIIHIERSVTRKRNVKTTKTDQDRRVAVGDGTLALLKEYRPADAEPKHFIFSNTQGLMPWAPNIPTMQLKTIRERLGLGVIHPRALRHYVATQLIGNGVDVRTVAGRLGHSSTATTLNIYAEFMPENDHKAAAILGGLRQDRS